MVTRVVMKRFPENGPVPQRIRMLQGGLIALMSAPLGALWAASPPPLVPAIPGAQLSALKPPALSPELAASLQAAQPTGSALTAPSFNDTALGASNPPALEPVPAAPTVVDVQRAERHLKHLRAQVRSTQVAEAGAVGAGSASHVRSRMVFAYLEGSLYEIYTAPDRLTTIELAPGEHLTTDNGKPKAADAVQWIADTVAAGEGAGLRTLILIKPLVSGIETNLLIPTNRHVYNLILKSASAAYMPLVAFTYPQDEARSADEALKAEDARTQSQEVLHAAPDALHFNYAIKGPRVTWKPLRVLDDGSKTYIQMNPALKVSEAPALFALDEHKDPLIVNYRVKGEWYIADRLMDRAELRIGAKDVVEIQRER